MTIDDIRYKDATTFEKRYSETLKIMEKYPNRIPVLCERIGDNINLLDKKKFLVPKDITLGEFLIIIRRRLIINESHAIFCFINNKIPTISSNMATLYSENKDEDGYLYIDYSGENCFGCETFRYNFLMAINRIYYMKLYNNSNIINSNNINSNSNSNIIDIIDKDIYNFIYYDNESEYEIL
jgi:GABA(A) receptor-associated protein